MLLPTHRLINYKKPINFAILEKNFKVDEFKISGDEESARKRLLAEMKKLERKGMPLACSIQKTGAIIY